VPSIRRNVRLSADFLALAKAYFPEGGSATGTPSFEMFSAGPLDAAMELFGRSFEELPEEAPGIRAWNTLQTPFFPPIVFYGALVEDYVELMSLTVDNEYWEQIDADPES
jgi:hypothetical protein